MYRTRSFRLALLLAFLTTLASSAAEKSETKRFETVHTSNAAILQRLGLAPVRIPEGHHKKRLSGPEPSDAVDIELASRSRIHQPYSRRHGHSDSHVYVVKLPPSQPYYTLTKPHKAETDGAKDNEKKTKVASSSPQVGFHSNGKPGKIYHWNLPLVKKISEKKKYHAQLKMEEMRRRLEGETKEHRSQHPKIPVPGSKNSTLTGPKKASNPHSSSEPGEPNAKHYHHSTSLNSLNHDEKPTKHTRNNDKRLNYPRLPEQIRKPGSPENNRDGQAREDNEKVGKKNNKKSYRLEEDSNLYRLESRNNNERHKNDRLAVWSLSNELHASGNALNSSLRAKKHRKKAALSYYAPINSRTSKIDASPSANNVQQNFSSNGKPKAFYVMEKSRQPVYYHPLLP
ncbi:uncharacterized protein [Venturia canescens]|uniref:uncharacterized protein isoform X2 n=1 Tax=Venturia canescens TaxID=32260 RepID=UPI001C9C2EB7|nr:uncharacterized protein LOC122413032 isoform X2 [Venturia canescens]